MKEALLMSIGEKVLALRLSKNISLSALSHLTGLSTNFLFDLENNSVTFTADDIEKIASALGVYKSDIFAQWEADNYEDYHHAKDDKERLEIFNLFSVPEDLLGQYLHLTFDNQGNNTQQAEKNKTGKQADIETSVTPSDVKKKSPHAILLNIALVFKYFIDFIKLFK